MGGVDRFERPLGRAERPGSFCGTGPDRVVKRLQEA
jgi:hypothetical protein